ncbi:MAG: hypothetical protein AB1941_19160 [Gemmatimonadota bacterium]
MARETTVRLYKEGDRLGIVTNAPSSRAFAMVFSAALTNVVEAGTFDGDWRFQFDYWIPYMAGLVSDLDRNPNPDYRWLTCGAVTDPDHPEGEASVDLEGQFDPGAPISRE